jgi:gamma-glutamylcyclotransferase (GGCT)/AIG2-like uncharacterized protein YtfP
MDSLDPRSTVVSLFTYGTLMSGQRGQQLLASSEFVETAATIAQYTLLDMGWYPALCEGGTSRVIGEVFQVSLAQLKEIDEYEGCPGLYQRKAIELENGQSVLGYVLPRQNVGDGVVIADGDWRAYGARRDGHSPEG